MLCWSMVLDFQEIASLLEELGPAAKARPAEGVGLLIQPMHAALLDAVVRLTSRHGGLLQRMTAENGNAQRLVIGMQ
jgi:hypothetical protein